MKNWIKPINGQEFRTFKGEFKIVGDWKDSEGQIVSFEIEAKNGAVSEVDLQTFMENEPGITYIQPAGGVLVKHRNSKYLEHRTKQT